MALDGTNLLIEQNGVWHEHISGVDKIPKVSNKNVGGAHQNQQAGREVPALDVHYQQPFGPFYIRAPRFRGG